MARVSKLEKYKDVVIDCIHAGMSYEKISDYLFDNYDLDICSVAVYNWSRSHNLLSKRTLDLEDMPYCDTCEHCKIVLQCHRNGTMRVCTREWSMVPNVTMTSPVWCPLRGGNNV